MIEKTLNYKFDLSGGVDFQKQPVNLACGEAEGHTIKCAVTESGDPVTDNASCTVKFLRADGNTVVMAGSFENGIASITLPQACYVAEGPYKLTMSLVKGEQVSVVLVLIGYVKRYDSDAIVDPAHTIPDIDALLAQIDRLEKLTDAAEEIVDTFDSKFAGIVKDVNDMKDEVAEVSEAVSEATYINNNQDKSIDVLWKVGRGQTWDTTNQTEEGTNNPPSDAEAVNLVEAYGKTTQNTTSGTNYIPPVYSQGRYGLTVTYDPETNMIHFDGTANQTVSAYDIYAVGTKNSGWTVDDPHITIPKGSVIKAFSQNIVATRYVDGEFTSTTILSTVNKWLESNDIVLYRFTNRIPLTKDTTPEPLQAAFTGDVYEPYTGGIPSPSPEYPQEIKSVESIDIKVTGKNLCEGMMYGYYDGNTGNLNTANKTRFHSPLISVKPNTQYTINAIAKSATEELIYPYQFTFYDKYKKYKSNTVTGTANAVKNFETTDDVFYVGVSYRNQQGTETVVTDVFPQLEEGSVATDYEPYHEQTRTIIPPVALKKVDGVHDYVDITSGLWVINSDVIDLGSLSWTYDKAYARFVAYISNKRTSIATRQEEMFVSIYRAVTDGRGADAVPDYSIYSVNNSSYIYVTDSRFTSQGDFKNALNGVTATYVMAAPTTEPINPDDLMFLKSLANTPSDNHITITDNKGNDLSWLAEYIVKLPGGGGGSAEFASLSLIFKGHFSGTPDEGVQPLTIDSINSTYAELVDGGKFKAKKAGVYVVKLTLAEIGGTSSSGTDVSVMLNDITLSKKQLYTRDGTLITRETHALAPGDMYYITRGYSGWVSVQDLEIYILK